MSDSPPSLREVRLWIVGVFFLLASGGLLGWQFFFNSPLPVQVALEAFPDVFQDMSPGASAIQDTGPDRTTPARAIALQTRRDALQRQPRQLAETRSNLAQFFELTRVDTKWRDAVRTVCGEAATTDPLGCIDSGRDLLLKEYESRRDSEQRLYSACPILAGFGVFVLLLGFVMMVVRKTV